MTDVVKPTSNDPQTELLLRQVETKVKLEGKGTDNAAAVSFGKLISTATAGEKCMLYTGWFFAFVTGSVLPLFFFFIGPIFDSFGGAKTPEETRDQVRELCFIMLCLSIGIAFASFFQNYLLMNASATLAARLKTRYLKSVLSQESAWYDQSNYMELSARMSNEIESI